MQRLLLFIAVVFSPLVVRIAVLVEQRGGLALYDLRGLLSDLLIALVVYAIAIWLLRFSRFAMAALIVLWCLLNLGNYEHVLTLGASADFRNLEYLLDPTFFLGSAMAFSSPGLASFLLGVTAVLLVTALKSAGKAPPVLRYGVLGLVGMLILMLIPLSSSGPLWRQGHFVDENVRHLFSSPQNDKLAALSPSSRAQLQAMYAVDLSGAPIVRLPQKPSNVLLLILEGISGVQLASIAQAHGVAGLVNLPALDQFAQNNLTYSTFISHNRQTNRGEYAILCGAIPALVNTEPKMTRAVAAGDVTCLPDLLREAGYTTAYLQAAPLGFMSKDAFMPLAGFGRVHGEEWFRDSYAKNQWGIDDRAFLAQSIAEIEELQTLGKPWFLTLLTVGTHHPYIVPPQYGPRTFVAAVQYLDAAVAEFLHSIGSMGVLENTLVLITSDESVGLSGYRGAAADIQGREPDAVTDKLADVWGLLIAITPDGDKGRVDEVFSQADIAVSVLDYLGLADVTHPFVGRSVFRRYDSRRPVPFGNLYKKFVGAVDAMGKVHLCQESFADQCQHYAPPAQALFSSARKQTPADAEAVEFLQAAVSATTDMGGPDKPAHKPRSKSRTIPLAQQSVQGVRETQGMYVLFGGQYLSTAAHSKVSVEIDVVLDGTAGELQLGVLLQSDQGKHFARRLPPMSTGERLRLAFDYYSVEAMESLALIGTVTPMIGSGMLLRFERASLTITELSTDEAQSASALNIEVLEVTPAN